MPWLLCLAMYSSPVQVTPVSESCQKVGEDDLNTTIAQCHASAIPCEARRVGALKWFVTYRRDGK